MYVYHLTYLVCYSHQLYYEKVFGYKINIRLFNKIIRKDSDFADVSFLLRNSLTYMQAKIEKLPHCKKRTWLISYKRKYNENPRKSQPKHCI